MQSHVGMPLDPLLHYMHSLYYLYALFIINVTCQLVKDYIFLFAIQAFNKLWKYLSLRSTPCNYSFNLISVNICKLLEADISRHNVLHKIFALKKPKNIKVFMKRNFGLWVFCDSDSFWGHEYGEHICFWLQQASGPRAAKTASVTSLVRVGQSKDGILKQWESELDSSSNILQCLNAVSSYKDYWILCIFLHIKTRL